MFAATSLPDFKRVAETLRWDDPSEVHGMLCGMLCADVGMDEASWLSRVKAELSEETWLQEGAEELLLELFAATVSQLDDDELSFSLLLPGDETPLSCRANSLGCWCQGFLAGLGLASLGKSHLLSAQVQEFLGDLVKISRLDREILADEEEDEEPYMEIVEYVRMGVLLVDWELRAHPHSGAASRLH